MYYTNWRWNNNRKKTMTQQIAMDSRRAWVIWFIATFYGLFQFILQGSIGLMVPELMSELSINSINIGTLTASYFMTYLLLQVPAGILVDRFGARRLLIGAIFLCVSGCFIFATAKTYWLAMAGRLIMGIGTSPAILSCFYLAANWFSPQRFALVVGLTEALAMFGGAVGAEALALYIEQYGWRFAMLSCGLLGCLIALAAWCFVQDAPRGIVEREKPRLVLVLYQLKVLLRRKQIWLCGLFGGFLFSLVAAFAGLWSVSYLMQRYDVPRDVAAWGSAILFIGVGVGAPLIGWFARSVAKRRPLMFVGNVGAFCLLVLMLLLPTLSFSMMLVLLFCLGVCSSVYMLPFAIVSEITSIEGRGCAMGFTNALVILFGAPLLQPVIGWLLHHYGHEEVIDNVIIYPLAAYNYAFWVLPCTVALGFFCLIFIRQSYCMTRPAEV
jgi:MFS family permease